MITNSLDTVLTLDPLLVPLPTGSHSLPIIHNGHVLRRLDSLLLAESQLSEDLLSEVLLSGVDEVLGEAPEIVQSVDVQLDETGGAPTTMRLEQVEGGGRVGTLVLPLLILYFLQHV